MHFTIKKVEEQSLPGLDAEFMKSFGVQEGDLETLKKEVRESMEREVENLSARTFTRPGDGPLYKDNPIEVPEVSGRRAMFCRRAAGHGPAHGCAGRRQLPPREPFEEPALPARRAQACCSVRSSATRGSSQTGSAFWIG